MPERGKKRRAVDQNPVTKVEQEMNQTAFKAKADHKSGGKFWQKWLVEQQGTMTVTQDFGTSPTNTCAVSLIPAILQQMFKDRRLRHKVDRWSG